MVHSLNLLKRLGSKTKEEHHKRSRIDIDTWASRGNRFAPDHASKNRNDIFNNLNSFILQKLEGRPHDESLSDLLSKSSEYFCHMLNFMTALVFETNFSPKIMSYFRDLVFDIHRKSKFPPDLYPSELKKLITLIGLPQEHKEKVNHIVKQEILNLLSCNPFLAKVFLLIFPQEVNLTFNRLSAVTSGQTFLTLLENLS